MKSVRPLNRNQFDILANDEDQETAEGAAAQEDECQECEGENIRVKSRPYEPTKAEIEDHEIAHVPFRSWCEDCVFGKAVEEPHRRVIGRDDEQDHTVVIDYGYLMEAPKAWTQADEVAAANKTEEQAEEEENKETTSKGMPILVMKHRRTKYISAHMVPRKGAHAYAVKRLAQDIDKIIGAKRITLKSDQEKAV